MIDIYNIKLIDILPPNLKQDPDIIAAAQLIDGEFSAVVDEAKKCIIIPRIKDIEDSDLIDLLAWQFHVDFYDTTLPLEIRKQLVENSIAWHKYKGTRLAIEELLTSAFSKSIVQEWFEYGGEPYHFRIFFMPFSAHSVLRGFKHKGLKQYTHEEIRNESQQSQVIAQLIRAINTVKNVRSYFEGFVRYGTHAGLRSFTHKQLGNYSHQKLLSETQLNFFNDGTYGGLMSFTHNYLASYKQQKLSIEEELI